jgi:hypothetical protein
MMDNPTAWATLIFAAMAGIGSVVRVYQNERFWRSHRKHSRKK